MENLIHKLRDLNIDIDVVDNNLKLNIPDGFNAAEVIEEIKLHKEALISFIKKSRQRTQFNPILTALEKDYYVLSSVQKRLHFLYEFNKVSLAYNVPQFVRMEGDLDKDQLGRAFQQLVDRHEALRTSFHLINEEAVQKINPRVPLELEYFEADEEEAKALGKSFIRPFDLTKAPLMRVGVVKLSDGDHLLMVDMHHIITDGTSFGILNKEFMAFYHGKQLPPIKLHYKDYAEWQQSSEQQEIISHQKEFWLNEFSDDITPLQLPQDYPRPAVKGIDGSYLSFDISPEHTRVLKSLADKEDATMFALILAIFNVLLHRLSNRKDIVIGTPIAGREHADLEDVVGMFVAVLPIRNFPDSRLTFREFLQQVKTKIPLCFDNQAYSYEELIEALKLPRDTSRNPLFDVMFSYQNFDTSDVDLDGLDLKAFDVGYSGALFDMTLIGRERGGRIQFSLNYSTELFKRETVERFAIYFKQIGAAIMENMDVKLSEINILPDQEKEILLKFGNNLEVQNDERPVFQLFEDCAVNYPDRVALICGDTQLNYNQLNAQANQLAHYLLQWGVKKGDIIGLHMERSHYMIVSMFAILKAGAAYVAIDPEYPDERRLAIIQDAQVSLVLTCEETLAAVPEASALNLMHIAEELLSMNAGNPNLEVSIEDVAYVIYTSGSTGKPKGILMQHAALQDYTLTFRQYFKVTEEDRTIQQSSLSFDTIVEEIYPTLISGGALIILPEGGRNVEEMVRSIDEHQATILSTTPIVVGELNQHDSELRSLRTLISGGDLLLPVQIDRLLQTHAIYNTYGPAESCVCISYHRIETIRDASLLGKPIRNRQVYILNEDLKQVPVGVPGELCVSGKGLAKGYLNNETLNTDRFVANPFIPGTRMYRTGDLVKWSVDGTIEFVGRSDQQIKIRGYRIEAGEIEEELTSHPSVAMSFVTAFENGGNKALVAFYSTLGKNPLDHVTLRDYLSRVLPAYMIPIAFIWLEDFPINTNGKIDKTALPPPDMVTAESIVPPENELENWLVANWSELLNYPKDKISVTASFFELGGHSLKATVAVNKIRKAYEVEVPLREFFKFPDIRSLALYIRSSESSNHKDIPKAPEKSHYVLSSAQQRLYFLQQFDQQSIAYNIPQIVRLTGPLKVDKLRHAFQQLVDRHESFRTTFRLHEDRPVQSIASKLNFDVPVHEANETEASEIVKAFVRPFDLAEGPLLRVELIAISETEHILMTDMHHIISDGVSMKIIISEFATLYEGGHLTALKLQYKDYAEWQQTDENKLTEAKNYWLSRYIDIPDVLELPVDRDRPMVQKFEGDSFRFTLSESETFALRELGRASGTTMFMTGLSVFNVLLSRLTNQQDLVVGTPEAGRSHEDLSGIVGMFANTLALRNFPSGDKAFVDFLLEVKEATLAAFDHQSYQYETLIEDLQITRDTSRNPLMDVMFTYQKVEASDEGISTLEIKPYNSGTSAEIAKCDLSLFMEDHADKLVFTLNYAVCLFDESTIARFAGYLKNIIAAINSNNSVRLAEIDILSEDEKKAALDDARSTCSAYDEKGTVLDQFRSQVAIQPNKVAITDHQGAISYKELDDLSNHMALEIQRACQNQNTRRVALIMEPSLELVAGMLASLKLGCAFVPFHHKTPEERLMHMLNDCQPDAILVDQQLDQSQKIVMEQLGIPVEVVDRNQKTFSGELSFSSPSIDDPVYIIYTSGTTGMPKGVEVIHSGLTNLVEAYRDLFGVDEDARMSQVASPAFDATALEIWPTLTSGASLFIAEHEQRTDPEAMKRWLIEERISVSFQPTPMAEYLLKEDWSTIESFKVMTLGGDRLHFKPTVVLPFEVYNLYGPTEDTVWSTWKKVTPDDDPGHYSIGVPIPNKQAYILNAANQIQPVGVTGELVIAGAGVANGYLNNEALTAEKFVYNSFEPGERMYRSGDLARRLPGGEIEFLGRLDDQVKIRGFRIELAEIEDQLLASSHVKEAAALAIQRGDEKRLVAFCVAHGELNKTDLVDFLSGRVPDYMIPYQFVEVEQMPKTTNGKIDKKKLSKIEIALTHEYVAPESSLEHDIVGMLAALLRLEPTSISMTDNFFDLGGHSLVATVAVNKMRKAYGVAVPLRDFFGFPDLRSLAAYVTSAEKSELQDIPKAPLKPHYSLSSAQRRLYFLQQFDKRSTAYNVPQFVWLKGELDPLRLQKAFQGLVDRHESFRTNFITIEDEPVQEIIKKIDFRMSVKKAPMDRVGEVVSGFVKPFDLSRGPMLRAGLVEVSECEHLLMTDMHHIVTDGLSMQIIADEFMALYGGVQLSPLPLQYKDFAEWQVQSAEQIATAKDYWLSRFKQVPEVLHLPTDHVRPAVQKFNGDEVRFEISPTETKALREFSSQQGVTMFMTLLSAFNVLLSKLSNQQDIVVGTPTAGRTHEDLAGIVGMFVNTLALRNYPVPELTFKDFLQEVKTSTLDAFEHQSYQYETLVDALHINRDTSRNPLLDVMFTYQNNQHAVSQLPEMEVEPYQDGSSGVGAKFDLLLEASEKDEHLVFNLTYATHLFNRDTIERYCQYFQRIVSAVLSDVSYKLAEISILSEGDRHMILEEFNTTPDLSPKGTIVTLFDEAVLNFPGNTAIKHNKGTLTYKDLTERVDCLANYLISNAVGKGSLVGIMLERDPWMVTSILAVLKAGAAYVPIDPNYPAERTQKICSDAQLSCLIKQEGTYTIPEVSTLELNDEFINQLPSYSGPVSVEIEDEDLAYVIYTSGSTGNPKGVMVTHGSLFNLVSYMQSRYGLHAQDTYLLKTTFTFDVSCTELFGWFFDGGALAILPAGEEGDPHVILDMIRRFEVTHLNYVPSAFTIFIDALNQKKTEYIRTLKYIFLAGEALPVSLINRFNAFNTTTLLENLYGPTEATIYSTGTSTRYLGERDLVPIGTPVANVTSYVMDARQQLQPIGVPGELCIGGKAVTRGYLNNEALTSKYFVENPFRAGEKMYRTGDLVRWSSNGDLIYLGRIDHQVKVRGYRIELGEVERQVMLDERVEACVATTFGEGSDKYLVAYFLSEEKGIEDQLRSKLSELLPKYMVPGVFVHLPEFPQSSSGKVDRKALPDPGSLMMGEYVAPANDTEQQLVVLWSQVLRLPEDKISVTANFFELGGHSLRATVLVNKIRKQFGVEVPLRELFRYPEVQSLANYMLSADLLSISNIPKAPEKSGYALSSAQQRLYFLQQLDKESVAYNMPQVFRLRGKLDIEAIRCAFQQLVDRHESLRTRFVMTQEQPIQEIQSQLEFVIPLIPAREEDIESIVNDFVQPFDLSMGPLLRVSLVQIAPEDQLMLVDMHHVISDGVSLDIMSEEFMSFYNGEELPPLELQYKDYAEWQQSDTTKVADARDFWLSMYSQAPEVLELPTDFTRPAVQRFDGDTFNVELSKTDTVALRELSRENGTTMFMTMLSVYSVLLARLSNQQDIVVGTPEAGRSHQDLGGIIGMFANTLALRNYPTHDKTFVDFLKEVKESTLAAFDHSSYQYETLIDELKLSRNASRNPLLDVMFTYQNKEEFTVDIPQLEIDSYETRESLETAKCDLSLFVYEQPEQLTFAFSYATHLFKRETIYRFAEYLKQIISAITQNKHIPLSSIDILPAHERRTLLEMGVQTPERWENHVTVLDQFKTQVAKVPEQTALVDGRTRISYQELDQWSDVIAQDTINAVETFHEKRVVLLMDASVEMIVGMVASLKAGCSYIPIISSTPEERLMHMISDCEPDLILVHPTMNGHWKSLLHQIDVPVMAIEESYSKASNPLPLPDLQITDPVYIIYTSGTTGTPKGVEVNHEGLTNMVQEHLKMFQSGPEPRMSQVASPAFDAAAFEIWPALAGGAGLYLASKETRMDPAAMKSWLIEKEITMTFQPTPMAEYLLKEDWSTIDSLKIMTVAGDRLHYQSTVQLPFDVYNLYGPTEDTVWTTWKQISQDDDPEHYRIGIPIANKQVYIVNDSGQLQPEGVVGQLAISGVGLANGYINNETLTADKFVNNLFDPGKRMYLTGDLARRLSNGEIAFLGRLDDQVKIRGFRIEVAEIEDAILSYEHVTEAAVLAIEKNSEKHLVAYYVSHKALNKSVLTEHLSVRIPDYMIPNQFVELTEIPKTSNGKVDRKQLAAAEISLVREHVAPASDTEKLLVKLCADMLGVDAMNISMADNFFDMGGHSLKATILLKQIETQLKVNLPLVTVFKSPTLADLTRKIEGLMNVANNQKLITLNEEKPDMPGIYFIHDGTGDVGVYASLAEKIGHYNTYAIQYPQGDALSPQNVSIEDLARVYVDQITDHQPNGPYVLSGWSLGGVIACEVAHQLEQAGKTVMHLALMDARFLGKAEALQFTLEAERALLINHLPELSDAIRRCTSTEELWERFAEEVKVDQSLVDVIEQLVPDYVLKGMDPVADFNLLDSIRHINTNRTLEQSLMNYVPTYMLQAPVDYFLPESGDSISMEHLVSRFGDHATFHSVSGDHYSMMSEQNNDVIADLINSGFEFS